MIYFTSDLHFYHENVIKHANRPFSSMEEMNQVLINNWNKKVSTSDEIYILGDITMKGSTYTKGVLEQLNGRKYLIKGNHDRFADQETFDKGAFVWIKDYYELNYQNERFILFHYPIEEWNHFFRGSIHLHGHQHNLADYNYQNLERGLRRFDVGVDVNNMSPVSIDDIVAFFDNKSMRGNFNKSEFIDL
jgi:calcineurin-like phosphoesterase family protein